MGTEMLMTIRAKLSDPVELIRGMEAKVTSTRNKTGVVAVTPN